MSATKLSARRLRSLVAVGQHWTENATGSGWTVCQLHRKDGQAQIVCGRERRFVSLATLHDSYTLDQGGETA